MIKNIYNIFDFTNPSCLYCNSYVDIASWGNNNTVTENYVCQNCNEKFEFIFVNEELFSIVFTCQNVQILHLLEVQSFGLQKISNDELDPTRVWIPEFEINFKNKKELADRLSTYLLFS